MKTMSVDLIIKRASRILQLAPVYNGGNYVIFKIDNYISSTALNRCHFPSFTIESTTQSYFKLVVYTYEI